MLPAREKERLRIERNFLALVVAHPEIGLEFAGNVAQTVWHRDIHGKIADALLDILSSDASASAADIVRRLDEACPGAASVVSGSGIRDERDPKELAQFFAEELSIRDMEDLVKELSTQLKDPQSMSAEDYEMAFQGVVAMQKELTAAKRAHKTLGTE